MFLSTSTILFTSIIGLIGAVLFLITIDPKILKTFDKREKTKIIPFIITAFAGIITIIATIDGKQTRGLEWDLNTTERSLNRLMQVNDSLIKKLENQNTFFAAFKIDSSMTKMLDTTVKSDSAYLYYPSNLKDITMVNEQILSLEKKIESFEGLFLSEAENLLTLPLLKKDIENINKEINLVKQHISVQSALYAESQNQIRWILGTLGLGILSLVIPIFRNSILNNSKKKKRK